MTITATAPPTSQMWSSMPGWGITANLLPPEVVAARRLKVLRKFIVMGLAFVVVLATAGYAYALFQQRSAQTDLTSEQNRTVQLQAQQRKFSEVVALEGSVQQLKTELAGVMTGDVDVTRTITAILQHAPRGGSFDQVQLTVNGSASDSTAATSAGAPADGGAVLDATGSTHIGTMNLTGSAPSMPQVADLVSQLGRIPGVVGVFPTSQEGDGKKVQFTISLTLTDALLTHRYDVASAPATSPTSTTIADSATGGH